MRNASCLLMIAASLVMSCHYRATPARTWSFAEHIGVAAQRSGKECLEIRNPRLPPNSVVRLVALGPQPAVQEGRIIGPDESCRDPNLEGPDYQPYAIGLDRKPAGALLPVIAIVSSGVPFRTQDGMLEADLDQDGQAEHFRSCSSAEGLHFTVWTGPPLAGKLRWHQYHYLGYDVVPDCTAGETNAESGH